MPSNYVLVIITTPSRTEAEKIVQNLLERKLIACGNIICPITSRYWWTDQITRAEECMILAKTRANLFKKIEKTVRTLHSYEVPEIIALPIVEGSATYLDWLKSSLDVSA